MTRTRRWAVAGLICAGAALAGGPVAATEARPGERIGVEVTLKKASGEAGSYECATTVKDLSTQKVLAEPQITFRLGTPATTTSTDPASGLAVEISVAVTGAGEQVDHVVLVRRGGALVASQSVTVHLPL